MDGDPILGVILRGAVNSAPILYTFTTALFIMTATLTNQIRINWEYSGLQDCVNVLMMINRNGHLNSETMASYIRTIAYNYACRCESNCEVPTITGTGGWYVTSSLQNLRSSIMA